MLPRPESDGDGEPDDDVPQVQELPFRSGTLHNSLLTWRRAIVEAATRDAERVDTAIEILVKSSASSLVYDPSERG
jgi:hypothetical protein